jgi:ketosteroid isomerase-like protein
MDGNIALDERAVLETVGSMTSAFAAGEIDAVLATYEAGAIVVAAPGAPVGGTEALRRMFADFVAAGVAFTYGAHEVVVAGDLGLHLMQWTAPGPEGEQTALSVAVLRRQPDGSWRMVIDHPFGDGVLQIPS